MTQVTLRQAHKLVDKINATLADITIAPNVSVNIWDVADADAAFADAKLKLEAETKRQFGLIHARSAIRTAIQLGNQVDVNALVAKRKHALDEIGTFRELSSSASSARGVSDADALTRKVLAARESAKSSSYGADTVTISLLSEADIKKLDAAIQQIQLVIEKLEDELTTANATGKITISAETEATLRAEGLLI